METLVEVGCSCKEENVSLVGPGACNCATCLCRDQERFDNKSTSEKRWQEKDPETAQMMPSPEPDAALHVLVLLVSTNKCEKYLLLLVQQLQPAFLHRIIQHRNPTDWTVVNLTCLSDDSWTSISKKVASASLCMFKKEPRQLKIRSGIHCSFSKRPLNLTSMTDRRAHV